MTTIYKLTDAEGYTRRGKANETLWLPEGTEHRVPGGALCTSDVIHAYSSPLQAAFMDPAHGLYLPRGRLWRGEGDVCVDDGAKVGLTWCVLTEQIPVPAMTVEQRVEVAIRCALIVYREPGYVSWADRWLAGEDRSQEAAAAAAAAAWAAAAWAAWAAAWAAAAAVAAWAEEAAWAAAEAAAAAWAAEEAAAAAARAAGAARPPLNLIDILDIVCGDVS